MQSLTVTVPPATPAVSLADLKAHLRINDTREDSLLVAWETAAESLWEGQTRHTLTPTAYRVNLDDWPTHTLYLPRHPATSVVSVEYYGPDATWHALTGWTADTASTPARVVLPTSLPTLHPTAVPRVRCTFVAGGTTPPLAAVAIKLLVAHWWRRRETHGETDLKETPMGWAAVCDQFKSGQLGNWNEGGV